MLLDVFFFAQRHLLGRSVKDCIVANLSVDLPGLAQQLHDFLVCILGSAVTGQAQVCRRGYKGGRGDEGRKLK